MDSIHHLRSDRDDCLVGDCVAAANVLEWSIEAASHDYQPLGGSLTATALDAIAEGQSDGFSRGVGPWTFELEAGRTGDEPAGPVWRRTS